MSRRLERERKRLGLPWLYDYAWGYGNGPVGYVHDGDIYCIDCADNIKGIDVETHEGVMFDSEETDSPVICGGCGLLLPSSLTEEGIEHVKKTDGRTWAGKLYRAVFPWVWQ